MNANAFIGYSHAIYPYLAMAAMPDTIMTSHRGGGGVYSHSSVKSKDTIKRRQKNKAAKQSRRKNRK